MKYTSSSVVAVLTESMLWQSASSMFLCWGEMARGEGCCGGTSVPCVAPDACCVPAPAVAAGLCAACRLWAACRFCAAWRLCTAWRFCWACRLCCACRFCNDWWARFNWCCCTILCCTMLCCTLMCWCTASWWIGWRGVEGLGYGGESRWRFTCALWSASCSLFTGIGLWPRLSTAVAGRAGRVAWLRRAPTVQATAKIRARRDAVPILTYRQQRFTTLVVFSVLIDWFRLVKWLRAYCKSL